MPRHRPPAPAPVTTTPVTTPATTAPAPVPRRRRSPPRSPRPSLPDTGDTAGDHPSGIDGRTDPVPDWGPRPWPWSATRGRASRATPSSSSPSRTPRLRASTGTPASHGARPAGRRCSTSTPVRRSSGWPASPRSRSPTRSMPPPCNPRAGETQIENILGIHPASWAPNCDCAEQGFLSGWYAAAFSNYWSPGVGDWSQIAPDADRCHAGRHPAVVEPEHPLRSRDPHELRQPRRAVTALRGPVPPGIGSGPRPGRGGRPHRGTVMTRVALLPSAYPPALGGVEESTRHLALALVDAGDEVEVWTLHGDDAEPETVEVRDDLIVRRLPDAPARRQVVIAAPSATIGPRTLFSLRNAVDAFRPDVLHVVCFGPNGVYATALARLTGLPLVVSLQGETVMDDSDIFETSRVLRSALRRGLRAAAVVTGCSAFTLADAERRFGLAPGRGVVVPNGVDLDEIHSGGGDDGGRHPAHRIRWARNARPAPGSRPAVRARPRTGGAEEGLRPPARGLRRPGRIEADRRSGHRGRGRGTGRPAGTGRHARVSGTPCTSSGGSVEIRWPGPWPAPTSS